MRILRLWIVWIGALVLAGCTTTALQGYADPTLPSQPVTSMALLVMSQVELGSDMQSSLTEEATRRGLTLVDAQALLPPTRSYTDDDIRKTLSARKIEALLVVAIGFSGIHREYAGTMLSVGFGTGDDDKTRLVFGSRQGAFLNTHHTRQRTSFNARLVEVASGRVLWVGNGQATTPADPDFSALAEALSARAAAQAIFRDLRGKGVIGGTP